ncbi:Peptide chain release factor 1 [Botrimarina hoheduenensis]|uniref:Peptide chain release factor 1 n=1 Tax=Botrimarina hoheduenensis TaxID=2528000 RepID=A0A5C5W985_9BACT|nr:Peptide chain release factor 1 [Botrimarina hoheduenensis]
MHPAQLPLATLLADCDERRLRRSGPGGQHRNKVETAVVLLHRPTGLSAEANERRSQQQNRMVAVRRLRLRLAVEHRAVPADEPTPLWRQRSAGRKLSVSVEHDDYPALLAEALDHIARAGGDEALAAEQLAVSRTQLVRLLSGEPAALNQLNAGRAARGLGPLR